MKRFRTESGQLTMRLADVALATLEESRAYFIDGAQYLYQGRVYTLHRFTDADAHGDSVEMSVFDSIDGYRIYADPDMLGTFLPDVASEGLEFTRI